MNGSRYTRDTRTTWETPEKAIGFRLLKQMKNNIDVNWVKLQPIWQQIQQMYNHNYGNAYTGAASGIQPPASFQQPFADPQRPIQVWNSMNQTQRNLVAEREGEKAGRDAVQAWIRQEEGKLVGKIQGTSALGQYAQEWIDWATSYWAEREHLYMKEQAMQHHNESDVVRSAAMYLVHPVMGALDAEPTMNGGFILQSEDVNNTVRTDITFYRYTGTGANRPIAMLEFKRRGVIRPDQFDSTIAAAAPANGSTLFEGEALKLIKQAAAYAMMFPTRHVALCDWNYLVLCYFVDMPYNQPANVGDRVEIQYIPIGNPSTPNRLGFNNSANSQLFRPALLGFLKSAYDETP